tara:strand:+ start:1928 stop:3910 length:1983 start_codon:yes stop_codon:yes gene_type:complete
MAWGKNGTPDTLTTAGTNMNVSDLGGSKSNVVLSHTKRASGTPYTTLYLNNDNSNNSYSRNQSENHGSWSGSGSVDQNTVIYDMGGDDADKFEITYIFGRSSSEKLAIGYGINAGSSAGESGVPESGEFVWKWENTSDTINRVDNQAGMDNYDIGSNLSVIGADITPADALTFPTNVQAGSRAEITDSRKMHNFTGEQKVHTFTTTGNSTFQITAGSGNVEYLVVAGGAGGGSGGAGGAGGGAGGAGGMLTGTLSLSTSTGSTTIRNTALISNVDGGIAAISNWEQKQGIKLTSSESGRILNKITVNLKKTGTPTGNVQAVVIKGSNPQATVSASSNTIVANSLTSSYVETTFTFSSDYTTATDDYIMIIATGGASGNYVQIQQSSGVLKRVYANNGDTSWTGGSGTENGVVMNVFGVGSGSGNHTVTVGTLGAGSTTTNTTYSSLGANAKGSNGNNSGFHSITSTGGGGGAGGINTGSFGVGADGGSGGGDAFYQGAGSGISGQGNDGGDSPTSGGSSVDGRWNGGGGGGAGTAGAGGSQNGGGAGGSGLQSSISGTATYYAGGGGGGVWQATGVTGGDGGSGLGGAGGNYNSGGSDATGYGSGGGGGGVTGNSSSPSYAGGDGSQGIVIVSYVNDGSITATGGTITTVSGIWKKEIGT